MRSTDPFLARYLSRTQFYADRKIIRDRVRRYAGLFEGRVLDVGAGKQPYRDLFPGTDEYIATNTRAFYAPNQVEAISAATDVWIEDAAELPFGDESVGGLVCFQVLSVLADPAGFFGEARRVLQPGGVLMLTTDFLYPAWAPKDMMRHTRYHLECLARQAGFEIKAVESVGGFYTMLHSVVSRYMRDLPQRLHLTTHRLRRFFRASSIILVMLMVPVWSLAGVPIYVLERHTANANDFAVAFLLICRKAANSTEKRI